MDQEAWEKRKFRLEVAKLIIASVAIPIVLFEANHLLARSSQAQATIREGEQQAGELLGALVAFRTALLYVPQVCLTSHEECVRKSYDFTREYLRYSWYSTPVLEHLRETRCLGKIDSWRKPACLLLDKGVPLDDAFTSVQNAYEAVVQAKGAQACSATTDAVTASRVLFYRSRIMGCAIKILTFTAEPKVTPDRSSYLDGCLETVDQALSNLATGGAQAAWDGLRDGESDFQWGKWGCPAVQQGVAPDDRSPSAPARR
jgi:hypothetical protein